MRVEKIHIEHFLDLARHHPVIDVRSPAEYKQAHIPGACSLPLFTDEERKLVGTAYKQQSREVAIKIGLDFFGPKMREMVEKVEKIVNSKQPVGSNKEQRPINNGETQSNCVLVHCWRGGMRSAGVAWLLDLYGFKVYTLQGGYKAYRNYVLNTFSQPYDFKVVGGYSGSGKTHILKELEKQGEKVIDLEALAQHKGSAFGAIGEAPQPTQEMFENLLSGELHRKAGTPSNDGLTTSIWLEDESQRIGLVNIQQELWKTMRKSPVYFIDIPFEERLNHVAEWYGKLEREKMVNAIIRIGKRLGGLETKNAINFLLEDNVKECFSILLKYYDKYYLKGLHNRDDSKALIHRIPCEKVDAVSNTKLLLAEQQASMATNLLNNE